jgi:UDP-N-acetylmuramoyl-L-alanyl-D-glutamate--2,6-diaminopimelate ligase
MKLTRLLQGVAETVADVEISGIALDSRLVKPGAAFIAVAGSQQHGLNHAIHAIDNGAVVVIYDPDQGGAAIAETLRIAVVAVAHLSEKLGEIAANFYRDDTNELSLIGITGTNGKTTCSQFLAQALSDCGVIGTLGWGSWGALQTTLNTTPDAIALQQMLSHLHQSGKTTVVMEVSSHGLAQGRVNGLHFRGALFTNLSRDHLDYHRTMDEYLSAKMKLLAWPGLSFAVVNLNDKRADEVLEQIQPGVKIWGFRRGLKAEQRDFELVYATEIIYSLDGIEFKANWRAQQQVIKTRIAGVYNLENLLGVLTVLLAMDVPLKEAAERLAALQAVKGRMESFGGQDSPRVFVDYAHTPDALAKLLSGIKPYCNGKLIVVFGCGGDRDKGKRALMGQVVCEWADQIVLTDDNPRFELPETIVRDILQGIHGITAKVQHDRASAIKQAIISSDSKDCIVIAGKGHEEYQDRQGKKKAYSDQQIVIETLTQL